MIQNIIPEITAFIYPESYASNSYLIKGKRTALIDSGDFSNAKQLISDLKSIDVFPEDIELILHTHGHADHFGADQFFPKAEIQMSKEDAEFLEKGIDEFSFSNSFANGFAPKINKYLTENKLIEFGNPKNQSINSGNPKTNQCNFKLKIIPCPGHTIGGVSFFEENKKILFSGDTIFNGNIGRYDLMSSNAEELKKSIQKLSELSIEWLLPGHGEPLKGIKEIKKNFESVKEFF
ncbi:MAG: MBL fold metallo-hydrolase [Candidatus Diapherotrites archaeon]